MEKELKKTIASSTILIMILTLISYGIGFLTQILIARALGAGKELDTFVAASVIPEFIFGLTNAIFLTSFVVIFPELLKKRGEAEGNLFVKELFTFLFCILCLITFFLVLFAPFIARLLAPGFSEEQYGQTETMIQILSLAALFFGMSSFTTGILYHEYKFTIPNAFRIILGLGLILAVVFLEKYWGAMSLAIGTVFGAAIAFLVQYAAMKKMHYTFSFLSWKEAKKRMKDSPLQELFFLSWPLLASSCLYYLTKTVVNMFASTLGEGSVSTLNYAFVVVTLPVIFFSGSIATSVFPHMTKQSAQQQSEELKRLCTKALRLLLLVFVPITCILMLFSTEIIRLLFERGEFTAATTQGVAAATFFFAIGLIPSGIWSIIMNVFYAKKHMKEQLGIYSLFFLFTVIGSFILIPLFSSNGIALGWSLAYWFASIIAFWYSVKRLNSFALEEVKIFCLKLIAAAGIMSILLFFVKKESTKLFTSFFGSFLSQGVFLIIFLMIGVILYLLLLYFFKESGEIRFLFSLFKQQEKKEITL